MDYNFYDNIDDFSVEDVKAMQNSEMLNVEGGIAFAKKVKIPGTDKYAYIKSTDTPRAIGAIASARMYKYIGIATPPVTQILFTKPNDIVQSIQPDVSNLKGKEVKLANDLLEFKNITGDIMSKYKWEIFEEDVKAMLLTKMTPECLVQFQNMFLVDELRSDSDRHYKNYFFYKEENAKEWQGVIVIDLEQMMVYNYDGESKLGFNYFSNEPYVSVTPQNTCDWLSHSYRIKKIKELIKTGCLSKENIQALKNALEFDLPAEVKVVANERGVQGYELFGKTFGKEFRKVVGPIEQLWKYNRKELAEDLQL